MKNKLLLFFLIIQISVFSQVNNIEIDIHNNNVEINWLQTEEQVEYYLILRKSAQINNWIQIAKVAVKNHTHFSVKDNKLPAEKFFYRIAAALKNGDVKYSKIFTADLDNPFRLKLDQNYPNPFNPGTNIKYSIPVAGFVDLRIYNILGQEISILVSEYKEPGEYTVRFNADELNSGLYIYKLITADQVLTRKMTLIK